MSYTVSIKPVKESDLNILISTDGNISLEKHELYTSIKYTKDNKHAYFDYSNDEISFSGTPNNSEMEILQELALKLNAKVVGEDGTDLTGTNNVETNNEGCGITFYTVFGIIFAIIVYWFFIE